MNISSIWRPISVLLFLTLIVLESFKVLELTEQTHQLIKLIMGGYVIGRSVEKVIKKAE